ncbi:uncharacterized protein LACBIDRAFT_326241 [Laccaria bicolor S238N-H82]|uniref:Predicted protein n=1 Tax=Laccaria bicolor (strain S238N-H82 / ATCC MYA-4686) TaxID=486041 RepID=B0D7S1_LACBS|nr:uncharacterized protein LACBIDRAFT_326241 [Laccaria bicolor S238N-H82]EDR09698.1 predicted protein [Laccaria bicolor S238N-H82]|eukprot:XP_001880047.1 predicted protein [Laccaria bicolor S238N-H82]
MSTINAASSNPSPSAPNQNDLPQPSSNAPLPDNMDSTEDMSAIRRGMERGYALSPMYSLIIEYNREQGNNFSTAAEVSWILQQPNLKPSDIILKKDHPDPYTLVAVGEPRLRRLLRAVTELQTFLDRMANLIDERSNVFRVDPQDTMTTALQGCESRSQLEVAYSILLKRLLTAQQTVSKYEAQYRDEDTPLSPTSTLPDLYDDFDRLDDVDSRMRYLLQKIPHHQGHLSSAAQAAVHQGHSWDVIHPTLPLQPELQPHSQALPLPIPSSAPFEPDSSRQSIKEGKKKVEWGEASPWDEKSSSMEQGRDDNEGLEPSFGFQTPFKGGVRFFDVSNSPDQSAYFSTPGVAPLPDVTVGLATPSVTPFADNVKQANQPRLALMSSKDAPSERNPHARPGQTPPNSFPSFKGGSPPDDDPPGGGSGGRGGGGNGGNPFPPRGSPRDNSNPNPNPGGPYRPGGGSGDPGGGGGGGPPSAENQVAPPAPYGNIPASIKTELKVEQLPEWDGNHWTAIDYFWEVQQLAHLGGWIPEALGYWLWFRLKDKSPVKSWFITLPLNYQTYMRSHYLKFLKGIKDGYLGHRWQLRMNNYYNSQHFRERNHERETPSEFIVRRIVYTRMLLSISGGPLEVFYIMRKAPISWGPILLISSIKDSSELYSWVTEHEEALLEAFRVSKGGQAPSIDNIVSQLKQMGLIPDKDKGGGSSTYQSPSTYQGPSTYQRRANLVENSNANPSIEPVDETVSPSAPENLPANQSSDPSTNQHILREAYQVLKQRQRPPPVGGYPYAKNDHVTTKMGRLPPSPCKCCGSANHWDKECPDWNTYLEKAKRSANMAEFWAPNESEKTYVTVYSILLNERLAGEIVNQPLLEDSLTQQDFRSASFLSQATAEGVSKSRKGSQVRKTRTTMEEVEDEDWLAYLAKPKSSEFLMEEVKQVKETLVSRTNSEEERVEPNFRSPSARPENETKETEEIPPTESSEWPGPPIPDIRVRLKKKRFAPAGASAVGVSVVAVQGWVGSTRNKPIDIRLDSCADVTLISQEYLESLQDRPPCQNGLKMNLWQLTDKDATLQGYVRIPIFFVSSDGILLETEAEAYVVPNMTVPILLGEDYHVNYELIVAHKVDFRSVVNFVGVPYSVPARGVSRTKDFGRMRQSTCTTASFIKARLHKRNKARKARKIKSFGIEKRTVRAAEDYRLRPDECRRIRVDGHFEEDKEWLVEKNLLAAADDSTFVVPNVLISASNPWIPVSNPSPHPKVIRKGDVVGYLTDPQEYFDAPQTSQGLDKLVKMAEALVTIIAVSSSDSNQTSSTSEESEKPSEQAEPSLEKEVSEEEEPEAYGPKTAELPDTTEYPSLRMREFLDVGSLPEHLQERAWEMLEKRKKAFGFDGRLGHHPSKVHIRTVDGQVPIAVPITIKESVECPRGHSLPERQTTVLRRL